jgi:putative transposase
MPWRTTEPMDQKVQFISDHLNGYFSFAELCSRYGVSRKTGYKWLWRYNEHKAKGLVDRSRRPHSCPNKTSESVVAAILAIRGRHPRWGATKLLRPLVKSYPGIIVPPRSTICSILNKNGCTVPPRKSPRRPHAGPPLFKPQKANELWTVDFKGHFKTGNGLYCYPLTVVDTFSRSVLACQGFLGPNHDDTYHAFTRLFQENGLPSRIRSDNGTPFSSNALGRLSRLSVWWIRLGIIPELIEPGRPEQNGIHERMHKTLKADTCLPPAASIRSQQNRFDGWRTEFNQERTHEALNNRVPADLYSPSPRPMPKKTLPIEYPLHFEVRRVSRNGGIRWKDHWVNVSTVLAEEYVGFEEVADGLWDVYFAYMRLGRFHLKHMKIMDEKGNFQRHYQ